MTIWEFSTLVWIIGYMFTIGTLLAGWTDDAISGKVLVFWLICSTAFWAIFLGTLLPVVKRRR